MLAAELRRVDRPSGVERLGRLLQYQVLDQRLGGPVAQVEEPLERMVTAGQQTCWSKALWSDLGMLRIPLNQTADL
jgi:hypothetical protein